MTRRRKPKPEDFVPPAPFPHIRWMIRRDMEAVYAIENDLFEFPWCEDDFIRCLRQRNCIGMVIDYDEQIAAYMIYELHKTRLHLLSFAVARRFQRRGFGRLLIEKLVGKLSGDRRTRITTEVRETNLDAQLFFRAVGFRAVSILMDYYPQSTEDAYVFEYRYVTEVESAPNPAYQGCL